MQEISEGLEDHGEKLRKDRPSHSLKDNTEELCLEGWQEASQVCTQEERVYKRRHLVISQTSSGRTDGRDSPRRSRESP
jgi:hypothetical protein